MAVSLKEMRERKGLTQQQLADMLNAKWAEIYPEDKQRFTVSKIVTMEKDSDELTKKELQVIAPVFGVTADQLLEIDPLHLPAPQVKNNWGRIENIKKHINVCIKEHTSKYLVETHPEALKELKVLKKQITRKPKIACVGQPDSGKSRTLNTLIGKDILPTNFTPTTSTIVYIKHISDKPPYWGNDTVFVFADRIPEPTALLPSTSISPAVSPSILPAPPVKQEVWDPDRIDEEEYCRRWQLASGDYSLIKDYGAHSGKYEAMNAGAIVVFADSPILQNCDLIDLPGFAPQSTLSQTDANATDTARTETDSGLDRDTQLALSAIKRADGYIYLSPANQFLYGDSLAMAQSIVKELPPIEKKGDNPIPPLGNLFIVASQALAVNKGDTEQLGNICSEAAKRIWRNVHDHPSIARRSEQTGYEYIVDTLQDRFFTSEMDSYLLTERFHSEFARFTEILPIVLEKRALEELRQFCFRKKKSFQGDAEKKRQLLKDKEAFLQQVKEMEKAEPERAEAFQEKIFKITDQINQMKQYSKDDCVRIYQGVISPPNILNIIETHGLKKNKRDLEELVQTLNSQLENRITTVLTDRSNDLKKEIDDFIADTQTCFEQSISARPDVENISAMFSVGQAFAGGLSGLAAYGALAAWAATCGNLGGYVLVAKGVSLLAAMGIHVGGTAAAISAVAAIGGPVVLGIAIAALAAVSVFLAFGGTWKKQIGNKLVKQYEKNGVLDKLKKVSDEFWDETMAAFRAGAKGIEADWQAHLKDNREKLEGFDPETLKADIDGAESSAKFFDAVAGAEAG